jgi:hypothetical protein
MSRRLLRERERQLLRGNPLGDEAPEANLQLAEALLQLEVLRHERLDRAL